MAEKQHDGLVARVRATTTGRDQADLTSYTAATTAFERRALLALRIVALADTKPKPIAPPAPVQIVETTVTAEPPENPAPPPPTIVAKPRKPPRVSMTSIRLEDAASLLAIVDADPHPAAPPAQGRAAAAMKAAAASMAALQAADDLGSPERSDSFATFGDDAT